MFLIWDLINLWIYSQVRNERFSRDNIDTSTELSSIGEDDDITKEDEVQKERRDRRNAKYRSRTRYIR